MDAIGATPLVIARTGELPLAEVRRQLRDAFLTALSLGTIFALDGRWFLDASGVDGPDFLIAGGLILLTLAVSDLVVGGGHEARGSLPLPDLGVVPIGTPLPVGPATLTTLLVLVDRYGIVLTVFAFVVNLLIAWYLFRRAASIIQLFGRNGLRAASKAASLLLAAVAIKLIREGIAAFLPPAAG
ncbi:MAG: hypothetical protein HYY30_09850 [Chloroflexi bacterium]|nr:hypothetical protein [Chloroflexota bacterium]